MTCYNCGKTDIYFAVAVFIPDTGKHHDICDECYPDVMSKMGYVFNLITKIWQKGGEKK